MRPALRHAIVVAASLCACSTSSPSGDRGGATDGGATADAGANEAGRVPEDIDAGEVTAPSATCDAPASPASIATVTSVVGSGTPASCTEAALVEAVAKGGVITFACGTEPFTLTLTKTLELPTDKDTVLEGGKTITLDGGGKVRILEWNHADFRKNTHSLTLQRITLSHGRATGTKAYAAAPLPCSSGFYDGAGGAVYVRDGVLRVFDSVFIGNQAEAVGPDIGGGAIYLAGALNSLVVGSSFSGNSGSNGGAVGVLNSDLDVFNSRFDRNVARGFGANGDDASKCNVVADTRQHQTGSGGNGGAIAIDGGTDTKHTFCGVTFKANEGGVGALGGALFRTPDGAKQTTVLDRCLFEANTGASAGAAYFHNSKLEVTDSTFTANSGKGTGAIQADGTTIEFTNVTFEGNHSREGVGATLSLFGVDGAVTNCTFSKNVCDAPNMFGAAIFGSPTLTIRNSIFDSNTGQNPGAPMQCQVGTTTGSGNLQWPKNHVNGSVVDALCVPGIFQDAEANLGPIGDHGGPVPTLVPNLGSPALARGTSCPPFDARGVKRNAATCTSGAVEGSN